MATINELDAASSVIKQTIEFVEQNPQYANNARSYEIALEALQDARRRAEGCHVCNNEDNMIIAEELGHNHCYNCGRALRGEKEERE